MATTNNSFHGPVGNFSFYKLGEKNMVRTKGGASKKTIQNSPSCVRIVQSNVEFGGASSISTLLRRAIGKQLKYFSDTNVCSNLTGIFRKIIGLGSGVPGQRILDLNAHGALLEGFEFNTHRTLLDCFTPNFMLTVSEERDGALLQAKFCPATDVLAPAGATSFQIVHTVLSVPRYGLCAVTKKYVALDDAALIGAQVSSAMLFTDLSMPVNMKLPVQLASAAAEGMSILCVVGIAFYAGKELMKEECGMGVVKIFI